MIGLLLPLAHAAHYSSILFGLPVLIFLGWLVVVTAKERKLRKEEKAAGIVEPDWSPPPDR